MTGMNVDLPGLYEEKNGRGRLQFVVRRGTTLRYGKARKVWLKLRPEHEGFLAAYQAAYAMVFPRIGTVKPPAAEAAQAPATRPLADYPPRSFGWLVRRYLEESIPYRTMAPAGRKRRRAILEAMAVKHGAKAMIIPQEIIARGFTARMEKIEAANYWLKSVKAFYAWALEMGITPENPAARIRKVTRKTDGFHIWSMDELRTYVQRHPIGTRAHLALMILLFTGFRREDAHRFGRQHIRDGKIHFRTGKKGNVLATHAARPMLDAIEAAPEHRHMAFLISGEGRPFASGNAFGNWFKDRCKEAGLDHCSAHGVRKAAASIAQENGATSGQLDAMFTWVDGEQRGTYTRGASGLKLATAGFTILENALREEGILGHKGNNLAPPKEGCDSVGQKPPPKSLKRKA
jgi:integrase